MMEQFEPSSERHTKIGKIEKIYINGNNGEEENIEDTPISKDTSIRRKSLLIPVTRTQKEQRKIEEVGFA